MTYIFAPSYSSGSRAGFYTQENNERTLRTLLAVSRMRSLNYSTYYFDSKVDSKTNEEQ